MKTIQAPPETEPACELECICGHRFWVDPCGEENLEYSEKHGRLFAVCPRCDMREEDEQDEEGR